MARERDPEELVIPKRRWPWYVLLLLVLTLGANGGFVYYVRGAHLATFRLEGQRGCAASVTYGPSRAVSHRVVTLPWEAGVDVGGGDVLLLTATPSAQCASVAMQCSIDVDTRARTRGADACAEYVGRVWAMVPGMR